LTETARHTLSRLVLGEVARNLVELFAGAQLDDGLLLARVLLAEDVADVDGGGRFLFLGFGVVGGGGFGGGFAL
jgi:hypothetical protein